VILNNPVAAVFEPLLQPMRYKGAYGGRGSAKSHFFAGMAITDSLLEKCDIICIRETQKSLAQSVKKLIEQKIEQLDIGHYFHVLNSHIEVPSTGGRIDFQGMQNHTAESIKSLQGYKRAWVEEAQSLSNRSLDLLRPTIREPGSEIWFSWNPNAKLDPVDEFLRNEYKPVDSVIVNANYRDNPWFPEVLRKEMEYDKHRDPDKYAHIWLGNYRQASQARVFKNWKIEEFERPPGTTFRLGADWGFSIDPSVLVRCSIDGNRLYIDYEAYMVGCEINNLPELFRRVPDSDEWFITADSARPETISYMRNHGYPKMNSAIKGARSVEEGIEFMRAFDIVVHPRCEHVIDEMTTYSYKVDEMTGLVMPILEDKNNHTIDALRYAVEGARRASKTQKRKTVSEVLNGMQGGASWMG